MTFQMEDELISESMDYECTECGEVFDSREEARNHVKENHYDKVPK